MKKISAVALVGGYLTFLASVYLFSLVGFFAKPFIEGF